MGDPGWAYKDTVLCPEEPEARNCLPLYGQSGECVRPERPQSNLGLCQNTGSVFGLFIPLALLHIEQTSYTVSGREAACLFQFEWMLPFFFSPSFCASRQHFHHAGSGSPSHPEGAGRRGHPPAHAGRPFIFCCQGAVDGKGIIPQWEKGQMCNFASKCKHIQHSNKLYKREYELKDWVFIGYYYRAGRFSLMCFPLFFQAMWRGELLVMNEQIHFQQR